MSDNMNDSSSDRNEKAKPRASIADTMRFVWDCGVRIRLLFVVGVTSGILSGLVFPAFAFLVSTILSKLSAASTEGLSNVREFAYIFMILGTYAFVATLVQSWSLEIVANEASASFRLQWFKALLRQDAAFFDVYEISGVAAQMEQTANKYRRGIGRKLGEGVQYFTTGVGGLAYAFYAAWRVALVVIAVIPFIALATTLTISYNQTKGVRSAKSYRKAGAVAYSTVSGIKTVLSLNAVREMIRQYQEATMEAFHIATSFLWKQGLASGSMLGTVLCLYAILTLYGSSLLYKDVDHTGCDPSDGVSNNVACDTTGVDVFGAMLGVVIAGQGISQCSNFLEVFGVSRAAVYEALNAINRRPGAESQIVYKEDMEESGSNGQSEHKSQKILRLNTDIESAPDHLATQTARAILPKFEIDVTSSAGLKPSNVQGAISFKNVHFSYPTRPEELILNGCSFDVHAGQKVAFVGKSGCGKSTICSLIERFYDPISGKVELDDISGRGGIDLRDLNVLYLRSLIGYVGQEPTLFATTIRENIRYGFPDATDEEVEAAAKLANAHDFIVSFSEGYDTQVGDRGSQLSGGQKQRIAISRILLGEPKILLLDEATSALDAESEIAVQQAIDNIMEKKNLTAIIIAHRLSTIRHADKIFVIERGKVVEHGTHDELLAGPTYYRNLVEKQEGINDETTSGTCTPSSYGSFSDLEKLDYAEPRDIIPLIAFKQVSFAYPTRSHKKVMDDFNLSIYRGQTIGLVGPSGGGKSTIAALIERYYDPDGGTVEFQGCNVKNLNCSWYRDQIGFVGQEPTLFNESITRNIAYGAPGATQGDIEDACKKAFAHDFIMEFSENYNTYVGERGTQLSGGQKQRIAIARALVKKPQVLILDEATSALDNESEAFVQAAIDNLMKAQDITVIVIAHRLSTIRNCDKIAFIGDRRVLEFGSHDELMSRPNGRYKRLLESSKRNSTFSIIIDSIGTSSATEEETSEEEAEIKITEPEKEQECDNSAKRARSLSRPDAIFLLLGTIGALMTGLVYPMWGVMLSKLISILFHRVEFCSGDGPVPGGFATCEDYWQNVKDDMQSESFAVAGYWALLIVDCIIGNLLLFWGFGMASERLNKRVRDQSFTALVRQEVAFFDMHNVGSLTSQLQDDAACIHAFSGDPVRVSAVAVASVFTGLVISFVFMWPFALVALGCLPFMGFATSVRVKRMYGTEKSGDSTDDTSGGILVETLLNMRTVAALRLEDKRYNDYQNALENSDVAQASESLTQGIQSGLSIFVMLWSNALQFWFGGWLMYHYPHLYDYNDFLIANLASRFALFGLGFALQDVADSKALEESAKRIFYLLDRKSKIDPLSEEGQMII